jgi:hypothetical protein
MVDHLSVRQPVAAGAAGFDQRRHIGAGEHAVKPAAAPWAAAPRGIGRRREAGRRALATGDQIDRGHGAPPGRIERTFMIISFALSNLAFGSAADARSGVRRPGGRVGSHAAQCRSQYVAPARATSRQ